MSQSEVREAGLRAFQQGNFAEAIPHLQGAIQENPEDTTLWAYLGLAYSAAGKRGQAIQHLRQAAALTPGSAAIQYNLGLVLEQSGDLSGARESFEQALALEPSHARARTALDRLAQASAAATEVQPEPAVGAGESRESFTPIAPAPPAPPAPVLLPPPPTHATIAPSAPAPAATMSVPVQHSDSNEDLPTAPVLLPPPPPIGAPSVQAPAVVPPVEPPAPPAPPSIRKPMPRQRLALMVGGAALVLALLLWVGVRLFEIATAATVGAPSPVGTPSGKRVAARDARGHPLADVGHTELATLTPLPTGAGIQVGEPVSQGADAATQAFGAGCSRWLQFTLAGQGELGKTPPWISAYFASLEAHKTRPRITRADAPVFAANLGVTHVAVAEVGGTSGQCVLRYRLLEFPANREVGTALTLVGTPAQVVAGLPSVARELCARMGVRSPQIPAKPVEAADALRAIGSVPWRPSLGITQAEEVELARVPPNSPLGGLLRTLLLAEAGNPNSLFQEGAGSLNQAPEHPLLLAEMARAYRVTRAQRIPDPHGGQLGSALKRFPDNYLLQYARANQLMMVGRYSEARTAAEHAVRCSPGAPSAWILLSGVYTDAGNSIRHGAPINQMTPQQEAACEQIYLDELSVLRHAAEVAPRNAFIGMQLSKSAAFAGDGKLADEAFARVVQRLPADPDVYVWGLQLYHPKWYPDKAKATQAAQAAARAAAAYGAQWSPPERVEVAMYASLLGHPEAGQRIVRSAVERKKLAEAVRVNAEQQVPRGR